jgi:quercetin dioxygenase-like cupin family protein
MMRSLLVVIVGIGLGAVGMAAVKHGGHGGIVRTIDEREIVEKLDGKDSKVSFVEVTLEPGEANAPHRHPGPVFGYVLEGEFEWAINKDPAKVFKAGETFYEPAGCLHRVSKSAAKKGKTRVLAVVVYPRDAKGIVIPEEGK